MEFKKYSSIENTYRKKMIDSIFMQGHSGGEWCVTEKVHGANFGIYFNGIDFKYAKKTCFIPLNEGFMGYESVADKIEEKVKALYKYLKEQNPELDVLCIYGEIFGGVYNHPDVEPNKHATKVQKEIHYTPNNEFYGFDIKQNGLLMDYDVAQALFDKFGILNGKILFKGTLEECLEYPNEYQTTIPRELGLPDIEGNSCEGNVIKPIKPKFFGSGSRVILKNKNEKFSEKKKVLKREKSPKPAMVPLSEEGLVLADKLSENVTENRLRNVLSHMGNEFTDKDFGKIMGAFVHDCIEDFLKDYKEEFAALPKTEQKGVTKRCSGECSQLLRSNFLEILDNEF